MKKIYIAIILLFFAQFGLCDGLLPSTVVWGKYCGECKSNCSTMREISRNQLKLDDSDKFIESNPLTFSYVFDGSLEKSSEYEKFKWLLTEPVPAILNNREKVFGQPDAYDQCGYYFMYIVNGSTYKSLIDSANVPAELQPVIHRLFEK